MRSEVREGERTKDERRVQDRSYPLVTCGSWNGDVATAAPGERAPVQEPVDARSGAGVNGGGVSSSFGFRWLAMPPLRPASRASSLVHSWAVPFWCAARPPLLAISRCLWRSIDAKPRSCVATEPSVVSLSCNGCAIGGSRGDPVEA